MNDIFGFMLKVVRRKRITEDKHERLNSKFSFHVFVSVSTNSRHQDHSITSGLPDLLIIIYNVVNCYLLNLIKLNYCVIIYLFGLLFYNKLYYFFITPVRQLNSVIFLNILGLDIEKNRRNFKLRV